MKITLIAILIFISAACVEPVEQAIKDAEETPFMWENANIYFLLTDRFNNGDISNDQNFGRKQDGAILRNFEGGDIKGITQKIEDGYFSDLGVTAIWLTPPVEQVHGHTDEGTGKTYGYHGYWTRDWTNIDPNFGTWSDLQEMVDAAHQKGIRILLDVVLNHTGPVTEKDSQWPNDWVRTSPKCQFQDFKTTVTCTLVENLPDIKTESNTEVSIPTFLSQKWKDEGRYDREMAELDNFFNETGFPRSPRHYIIKWLIDFIHKLGIDGYRIDTAKHTEPEVWEELYEVSQRAFEGWKEENPEKKLGEDKFYMMGEVYNYYIQHGQHFDMGGGDTVNFFDTGFSSLINFDLKGSQDRSLEDVFSLYSDILNNGPLEGYGTINYLSSHDDGAPFDRLRKMPKASATRLLLAPGASQIYYGDELARPLQIPGANGDANLRSFMNWEDLDNGSDHTREVLEHWQKLGLFKKNHPSLGAGKHEMLNAQPYTFKRHLNQNGVEDSSLVVLGDSDGKINVQGVFKDGSKILNYYTNEISSVSNGHVEFEPGDIFLMGEH